MEARHPYAWMVALAVVFGLLAVTVASVLDLPLRDPDGFLGPSYVRLPAIAALFLLADIIPRCAARAGSWREVPAGLVMVCRERWHPRRLGLALTGLLSFYVVYVAYRNLKSYLPFIRDDLTDMALTSVDRALTFGNEPASLLHGLLGVGFAAHLLSLAYLAFLLFVPVSLALALVWSNDLRRGFWYVSALCANWVLGTLSYYLLPSLGPVFVRPSQFAELPYTGVARLQANLMADRVDVLADPHATSAVHGIAAFASLHVSIVFTAALIGHFVLRRPALRAALWVFFALTVLATIYFGWHYLLDDVAGVGIGALAVWLGALATGHRLGREEQVVVTEAALVEAGLAPRP